MSTTHFKGQPIQTNADLPKIGQTVTFQNLVKADLSIVSSDSYAGKIKVLNIFPSIDTGICAASVRRFNKDAATLKNTAVLNISLDLPFAIGRFCGAEGISNCDTLSSFKSTFGNDYGLVLSGSPLDSLLARAVIVLSADNKVIYSELVSEITTEPNYEAALKAIS